jgi:hypothetical protein
MHVDLGELYRIPQRGEDAGVLSKDEMRAVYHAAGAVGEPDVQTYSGSGDTLVTRG